MQDQEEMPDEEIKLSVSPELSEGTPEPPKMRRPMRMKLLPTATTPNQYTMFPIAGGSGTNRRTLLPTAARPFKIRLPSVAGVSARVKMATERPRDDESPPTPASRGRTYVSKARAVRQPRGTRTSNRSGGRVELPRIVPRTRVLVTPERTTPPGLPSRAGRTAKNKTKNVLARKVRVVRRRRVLPDSSALADDTSIDSSENGASGSNEVYYKGNVKIGDSCDGDDESDSSDNDDDVSSGSSVDTDSSKELKKIRRKKIAETHKSLSLRAAQL